MSKQSFTTLKAGIDHAQKTIAAAELADKEVTDSLLILTGMVMSVLDEDSIKLDYKSDEPIFYDPNTDSADEDKIVSIAYDEDDDLIAIVRGDDDYHITLEALPLVARLELVKALIKRLNGLM